MVSLLLYETLFQRLYEVYKILGLPTKEFKNSIDELETRHGQSFKLTKDLDS